jgi:hypothetical protein
METASQPAPRQSPQGLALSLLWYGQLHPHWWAEENVDNELGITAVPLQTWATLREGSQSQAQSAAPTQHPQ